jgi:hypothetical protein
MFSVLANNKLVRSYVRLALGVVGGALVANGVVGPETAEAFVGSTTEIVVGLVPIMASAVWSYYEKASQPKAD